MVFKVGSTRNHTAEYKGSLSQSGKDSSMPVIAKFYGIVIRILCAKPFSARFHAFYENCELVVNIWPLTVIQGDAPQWVEEKVLAWARQHQQELLADWNRCIMGQKPLGIAPLP